LRMPTKTTVATAASTITVRARMEAMALAVA
jgi:hypothetical protein